MMAVDTAAISEAAQLIAAGQCVAVPTETVYGLAADATNGAAVAGIYAAKGRPSFNPLIVHVPDLAAAEGIAQFNDVARDLGKQYWPGPLTLVLPLRTRRWSCQPRYGRPVNNCAARACPSGDAGFASCDWQTACSTQCQSQRID